MKIKRAFRELQANHEQNKILHNHLSKKGDQSQAIAYVEGCMVAFGRAVEIMEEFVVKK